MEGPAGEDNPPLKPLDPSGGVWNARVRTTGHRRQHRAGTSLVPLPSRGAVPGRQRPPRARRVAATAVAGIGLRSARRSCA